QYRGGERTVTLYSLESSAGAIVGPSIIALDASRLKSSLSDHEPRLLDLRDVTHQDALESRHLLAATLRAAFYIPLRLEDKLKGFLVLALPEPIRLAAAEQDFLSYVGTQLALAIDNSDVLYHERRRGRQLHMVSEIARQAVIVENLDEFLGKAALLLREGFDY